MQPKHYANFCGPKKNLTYSNQRTRLEWSDRDKCKKKCAKGLKSCQLWKYESFDVGEHRYHQPVLGQMGGCYCASECKNSEELRIWKMTPAYVADNPRAFEPKPC